MNSRGLRTAIRCSDCAAKSASRCAPIQLRAFTNTSIRQKHGAVPAFSDVSSTELHDLLSNIRERIFVPAHLGKAQSDLVFKPKYKKVLETEPVVATIAGEDFTLQHLDVLKDIPGKLNSLKRATGLMKDKKDWDNLPNLLHGLKTSKFYLTPGMQLMVLRRAGSAGRQDVILECLRRVSDTGLVLRNPEFVVQVMWWIQQKAVLSDWDSQETKKALSWAEMVVNLLEDPKHAGSRILAGETDPRVQPEVIGILLQLSAVRASKHLGGKDVDGKVAEYAQKLLGLPVDFKKPNVEKEYEVNMWVSTHVPVLQGIKVAQDILDPNSEVAIGLKARANELEQLLSTYREVLSERQLAREKPLTGLSLYEKLLGSGAS